MNASIFKLCGYHLFQNKKKSLQITSYLKLLAGKDEWHCNRMALQPKGFVNQFLSAGLLVNSFSDVQSGATAFKESG